MRKLIPRCSTNRFTHTLKTILILSHFNNPVIFLIQTPSQALKTLSDGEWHRNMELKEKTKLSSRTLAKHLNQMANRQIIEKKTDVESGKCPVPVLYRSTPELTTYVKASITREEVATELEPALNESKDPLILLEAIHASSQVYFLELLTQIQQNKIVTNEQINFFAECFLWANYKQYTSKLIEASRKIINDLNIAQLLINQAKRQIIIYETALKIYEKMEPRNIHDVPRNPDDT
jgi:DNA-binding HxlR family transcriptional regulator